MKRKSLEELFDELYINKKVKITNSKLYTQDEVDKLLKDQETFLFLEFEKYINEMRKISEFNVANWTSV